MMATVMVTAATCNQKEKIEKHVPTPTDDAKGKFNWIACPSFLQTAFFVYPVFYS